MEIESVLQYLLPHEFHLYFDFINIEEDTNNCLLLYSDEKPIKPSEHLDKELVSKGFDEPIQIQDFPIREKAVYFIVRRCKWISEILNFFDNRSTNASAESFNAKLKDFRATLRGVTDINFFMFRVAKIYA